MHRTLANVFYLVKTFVLYENVFSITQRLACGPSLAADRPSGGSLRHDSKVTAFRVLTPTLLGRPVPGLAAVAARGGWTLNVPLVADGEEMSRTASVLRSLADLVEGAARRGQLPVALGGDCCQPIAVLAGLARAGVRPMLLWLDAHGDFNTHETTISGFLGGMPLAMLTGHGRPDLLRAVDLDPIPEGDVVLCDARNLDAREAELLAGTAVRRIASLDEAIAALPADRPVYVHVDADIVDGAELPALDYPEPGGPSKAEVSRALAHLRDTRDVVAVSMTAWAPRRDADGGAADYCLGLLDTLTTP
jgi:arginase